MAVSTTPVRVTAQAVASVMMSEGTRGGTTRV
jgi:hypothetical protein